MAASEPPVVVEWFSRECIEDTVTLLPEPRGRDGDLLVDAGLGPVSFRTAASVVAADL